VSGSSTERDGPDGERARAVLEARARALARPQAAEAGPADRLPVLVFAVAGETYAVELRHVHDVTRFTDFTVAPGAPPILIGVTNLRGEILPVFDLAKLVGLPPKGLTDGSRLVVLGGDRAELGLLADEVREAATLGREEVLDPPDALARMGRGVLLGVTAAATIVLDGAGLLRDPRLFLDEAAPAAASAPTRSEGIE